MGKRYEQTRHKRYTNGQYKHEPMFYIIIHQENENKHHNETPLYTP